MTSEEDMKRELNEKFEKLKKEGNPPGIIPGKERRVARRVARRKERREGSSGNPNGLQNCLDVRVTEDENIEIRFKDIPTCEPVKEKYRKILQAALMGGETIYKTLGQHSSNPKFWTVIHNGTHDRYYIREDALARAKELEEKYAPAIRVSVFEYTPDFTEPTGYKMEKIYPSG